MCLTAVFSSWLLVRFFGKQYLLMLVSESSICAASVTPKTYPTQTFWSATESLSHKLNNLFADI